ncbi:MAG: hypothetical protein WCI67_17460 [Chloroflexales bacterium]
MKIVTRTLIILAAALLVVGATLAVVSAGGASGPGGPGFGRDGFGRQPPAGSVEGQRRPGALPGGGAGFGDRGREGGRGSFSAFEILKNLVIITVIIAFVSLLNQAGGRRRPRRR